jgi:hypothetical protein
MKTPRGILHLINLKAMIISVSIMSLSSCIIVTDTEIGPHGLDGRAYYGIDYDFNAPYSYWDDNNMVPNNPFFGELYRTYPGVYEFEYFINPYDYWYGTYEVWTIAGEPGQPYNIPGADGPDTFLMMICNDEGFYFERWDDCECYRTLEDGTHIIEYSNEGQNFRVTMKKANISERPSTKVPKYKRDM